MEGRQKSIDEGVAAIDEAGVWPCDFTTNPSVSKFGSTAQVQARQLLPKLLHRIDELVLMAALSSSEQFFSPDFEATLRPWSADEGVINQKCCERSKCFATAPET